MTKGAVVNCCPFLFLLKSDKDFVTYKKIIDIIKCFLYYEFGKTAHKFRGGI